MTYQEFTKRDSIENPFIKQSYTSYLLSVFGETTSYLNHKFEDLDNLKDFELAQQQKLESIAKLIEDLLTEIEIY